jgi:hypothetical protein
MVNAEGGRSCQFSDAPELARNLHVCRDLDQSSLRVGGMNRIRIRRIRCPKPARRRGRPHSRRTLVEIFLPQQCRSAREMLEFPMNSIATVHAAVRARFALIVAGIIALLGSFAVTAPAQAGYYDGYNPCSYRCGYYPRYRYYPPYRRYGCYSCGSRVIYERRYIEREYVERRVGYGGYRHHYCGYDPCYRRPYGYYGGYQPSGYGYGGGYRYVGGGYGDAGVGRRWPLPFDGYGPVPGPYSGVGYDEPPRPPAPVLDEREY